MLAMVSRSARSGWLVVVLAGLLAVGCGPEEGVKTYKVAGPDGKDKPDDKKGTGDKPVSWTTPEGWKEGPGKQFRIATLQKEGAPDLVLSGPFGGNLLQNVNRWRSGDAGLPEIAQADLPTCTKEIKLGSVTASRVDLRGTKGDAKVRLLGAIIPASDGFSYFVKFVGPADKVDAHEKDFDAFLNSIRVAGSK